MASNMFANNDNKLSDVIRFCYEDYKVDTRLKIVSAKCTKCCSVIKEKQGTTSAFVRHLAVSTHPDLRKQ
jgi:hypothetical protein